MPFMLFTIVTIIQEFLKIFGTIVMPPGTVKSRENNGGAVSLCMVMLKVMFGNV
jgi:hypothetical protein